MEYAAELAVLKSKVGADCYEYAWSKITEMDQKTEQPSRDEADPCEQKFVIDMSSVRFHIFITKMNYSLIDDMNALYKT